MRPKLLLADDSVTIQRVIELTFADEEISVVTAGDGREAIERAQAEHPDIVLADVGMPEADGYEVAQFIKGHPDLSHIPVLLLTGAFEPVDEGRARAIGCEGVLVKPFEPQMVISRVRELLRATHAHDAEPVRPAAGLAPPPVAAPGATSAPEAADSERSDDHLEAYFDRLDAALANMSPAQAAPSALTQEVQNGSAAVAEMHARAMAVVSARPPAAAHQGAPRPERQEQGAPPPDQRLEAPSLPLPELHAAFVALLAAEEGGPDPFPAVEPAPSAPEPLTQAALDDIAGRVVERMGDARMRALVLDTAERLVREEIDRIKRQK